ncbi:MAG: DNA cytosine methyltransferase [Candidatus Helarchaeota archaeon]
MFSVLDLFCGAGGFSLGFQNAGYEIICGIDIDPIALETYKTNINCKFTLNTDISELHSIDLIRNLNNSNLPEIIIASPPCEPFTIANYKREKNQLSRLYNDPTGRLVLDAIRLIGDLQPKIFVMENVKNLIDGDLRDAIITEFKRIGFKSIYFNIISAEKYGCPSSRRRVFISNKRIRLKSNKITSEQHVINFLPKESLYAQLPNHKEISIPQRYHNKLYKLKWKQALVYFQSAAGKRKAFKNWEKLNPNDIAPTVMGNSQFIHPYEDRALTVREHAKLMTFPDNFIFKGGIKAQYTQVGEAVPPLISFKIAQYLLNQYL